MPVTMPSVGGYPEQGAPDVPVRRSFDNEMMEVV